MFDTLRKAIGADPDYPARVFELTVLNRVLDGTLYDALPHEFHEERTEGGEYVPLRKRRPSVRFNLCRMVVEDAVALLFGDGRFPAIDCPDATTRNALLRLVAETGLVATMNEAALRGSVGSAAVLMRVLRGRVFFDVLDTTFLTPSWQEDAPDTLARVTERYKVRGDVLRGMGYAIPDDRLTGWFWWQRVWDEQQEAWFLPAPVGDDDAPPEVDETRTVRHGLGFVPLAWIKNLPGPSSTGGAAEGACTFRPAIETQIEIDYQLSQAGRGLKYSSDPTLLIKEPAAGDAGEMVRGGANALVVSEKGDAKLLEIGGTAAEAVMAYARSLREFALESIHGNRATGEKLATAQSGKAMELMHQPLIWLADRMRTSYGEHGLLSLLRMVVGVRHRMELRFRDGEAVPELVPAARVSLRWPPWFHLTQQDRLEQAQGLATLKASGLVSRETAVKVVAADYEVPDPAEELRRIQADMTESNPHYAAQEAKPTLLGTKPSPERPHMQDPRIRHPLG